MAVPNLTANEAVLSINTYPPGVLADSGRGHASGVSWGAVIAGAAAAAALSLILLILGTGLGLSAVSPWSFKGIDATTFGVTTILWVTLTQLLASGMGGYIAGRLRGNWAGTQTDEIYFRDTAHGFLAWSVASLATAALLTSVIGSIVGGGVQAGATVAGGAAATAGSAVGAAAGQQAATPPGTQPGSINDPMSYYIDSLFRRDMNTSASGSVGTSAGTGNPRSAGEIPESEPGASSAEVTRIFMQNIRSGPLPPEDLRYVGQMVSQRTGVSQVEAERRVNDSYARMQTKIQDAEIKAKEVADKGREASAYTALWLFISLLIGAFFASWAAVYGGRHRDLA